MLTITHNAYKNKSDDVEFCIKKKWYTRVISKNIRHAPAIMEFFQEYEQYGTTEAKQITITVFDNSQSKIAAGF